MKSYLVISIITFMLFGLFVFGSLFGDVDDKGLAYMVIGAAAGVLFWFTTKDKIYFSGGLHTFFQLAKFLSWALASLSAVYGVFGILTNRDMLSGQKFDGMAGMAPYIVAIFAVMLFLTGLLFRWLAGRYTQKKQE